MKYQELVESVRGEAGLGSAEEARETVSAVLATLAHCLPEQARRELAARLPSSFDPAAEVPGQTEQRDGVALLIEIGERLDATPERARYLAQAALGTLLAREPQLAPVLRDELSTDVLEVIAPAGDSPGRAQTVRDEVPTRLSDHDVESALSRLPAWSGDHTGIARTVTLPGDRHRPLINRVQHEARAANDHVHVDEQGDEVTFALRTGRDGVVTEPDLELAARIDRVLAEVGGSGKPG